MDPLKYYLEEPTREGFAVLVEKTEDLVYRAARKVVENGRRSGRCCHEKRDKP